MPEFNPQEVSFQKNYDKESQHEIEQDFKTLISAVTGYCIESGTNLITEADVVAAVLGRFEKLIQGCKQLYRKYHENPEMILGFEVYMNGAIMIDRVDFITKLKEIQDKEIEDIAVKHKLMDRVTEREPWEETVKKKLWLNDEWTPVLEWFLKNRLHNVRWRMQVFLETAFVVLRHGDIVKLISGPNDSGKTWASLPQTKFANYLFRNFWVLYLKNLPYPDNPNKEKAKAEYTSRLALIARLEMIKKWTMKNNIIFYPEAERIRAKIADGTSFNCINVNEGMKSAINLRSFDQEAIDMILEIFTERASNNYMIFEYQQAKRPPKLLLGRFNVWQHKANPIWMVTSIPSSIYRTEDPFYMGEVEKIKGDRAISAWFTHRNRNANFIAKMRAPRLTEAEETEFKRLRKIAKLEYEAGRNIKKGMYGTDWYNKLEEIHELLRNGQIAYMKIPDIIRNAYGYTDVQLNKFMTDFQRYDMRYKALHPKKTISEAIEQVEV